MYWEKVPAKSNYAELMHRMSAKVNGAVTLKYAPPGEQITDPENLVTCVDNDHVQVRSRQPCPFCEHHSQLCS